MVQNKKDKLRMQKKSKPHLTQKVWPCRKKTVSLDKIDKLSEKINSYPPSNRESIASSIDRIPKSQSHSPQSEDIRSSTGNHLGRSSPILTHSFLDLNVRIFNQPLGLKNKWVEHGSGRVEVVDYTILVKARRKFQSNDNNPCVSSENQRGTPSPSSSPHPTPASVGLHHSQNPNSKKPAPKCRKSVTYVDTTESSKDPISASAQNTKSTLKKAEETAEDKVLSFADDLANLNKCGTPTERAASPTDANDEDIILEDTITNETTFVGDNYCIVWNSLEKKVSLCLIFSSTIGFIATWGALAAMQGKVYPHFEVDLLRVSVLQAVGTISSAEEQALPPIPSSTCVNERQASETHSQTLPYSTFIHDKYSVALGFIEKNFISACLINFGHLRRPELYEDRSMIYALLDIANEDLVEQLLGDEVYALLIKGLGCTSPHTTWIKPEGLSNVLISPDLVLALSKDRNARDLSEFMKSLPIKPESFVKLNIATKRLRNQIMCALLSSDEIFDEIKKGLQISLNSSIHAPAKESESLKNNKSFVSLSAKSISTIIPKSKDSPNEKKECVEQQVLANLRFLRSCITLGIAELGRDSVGPVVVKAFQSGILEVLSNIAECYAMPRGAALMFLDHHWERCSGQSSQDAADFQRIPSSPGAYSSAIAKELNVLLNATITSLSEERDEQLINEIVRCPILHNPSKYNGLMVFMLRQLVFNSESKSLSCKDFTLRNCLGTLNSCVMFHVLGLYGNESNIAIRPPMSPNSVDVRNRFHRHFISNYLPHVTSGPLTLASSFISLDGTPTCSRFTCPLSCANSLIHGFKHIVSPALIRVLDYLITLSSNENCELILKVILVEKAYVLHFIQKCCTVAASGWKQQRLIGLDVLSSNAHFIKTILEHCCIDPQKDQLSFSTFKPPTQMGPPSSATMIYRKMILESDIFGAILQAYQKLGGHRRNTMFHSTVLSMLDLVEKTTLKASEHFTDKTCSLRNYLFLKYLEILPNRYARRFRQGMMGQTANCLGFAILPDNINSISGISFTSNDVPHTPCELRFVDEIDASGAGEKGPISPESSLNISRSQELGSRTSEDKFLTILRTHSEQWTQSKHSEDMRRFSEPLNSSRELNDSSMDSQKLSLLLNPLRSSPTQIPQSVLSDKNDFLPVLAHAPCPSTESPEPQDTLSLKPKPPATKSFSNGRGRSRRSSSIEAIKVSEIEPTKESTLTAAKVLSTAGNSSLGSTKHALKHAELATDESLVVDQGPSCATNTVEKVLGLSTVPTAAQKKETNVNTATVLDGRMDWVLPCLKKQKPSAF